MSQELPLIGCALNEEQLAERERRLALLRPSVARVDRDSEQRATIDFNGGVDQELLMELVEAERECCSFFDFDWQDEERRLTIAIPEARFRPTLDALTEAIAGLAAA